MLVSIAGMLNTAEQLVLSSLSEYKLSASTSQLHEINAIAK